jgi:hypothetical protein
MAYEYAPKLASVASDWDFMYGKGTPEHPTQNYASDGTNAGFKFSIPVYPNQVDYLMCEPAGLALKDRIRIDYRIGTSGSAKFIPDGKTAPKACSIHIMIQRDGDDLTASKEDYRFWYSVGIPLVHGGTSTAPLSLYCPIDDLTKWTNVFGKKASDRGNAFPTLLNNLWRVGMTFGGAGHYGHGVSVTGGTAGIYIYKYSVK